MKWFRTAVLTGALAIGAASTAVAGQYLADTPLGTSAPTWMEALNDINDDGDVAWTSMDSGTNTIAGQIFTDNGQLTLNDKTYTWANGITERKSKNIWVVGSEASSNRWVDRHAVLWRIDKMPPHFSVPGPSPEVGGTFRIGENTPHSTDTSKTIQQSAAYGAVRHGNDQLLVTGYTRDRVSRSVLPQPTVWTINANNGSIATVRRMNLGAASGAHGNLVDIAKHPNGDIWACGSAAAPSAYAHAACWNVKPTTPVRNTALNSALSAEFGTGGNTIYSSTVMRVRTLSTHGSAKIAQHSVAIGAALVGTSRENATWKGWVYDLTDDILHTDFGLASGAETLVYDAAGIEYVEEGTSSGTAWGIMVGGSSTTTSANAPDALDDGPLNVTTLRGIERRSLLSGTTDQGKVCAIQDDSAQATAVYDQLVALSSDGQYRLAQAGGQLIRLVKSTAASVNLEIRKRDGEVQEHWYTNPEAVRHAQAQLSTTEPHAVLRLGRRLGCESVDANTNWLNGSCNDDSLASFDIGPITGMLQPGHASEITLPLNDNLSQTDKLHSEKFDTSPTGSAYKLKMDDYAQVAFKDASNSCSITPVWRVDDVAVENAATDFDGTNWQECGGAFVNIDQDYRHCSGCNQMAEVATVGNAHGRQLKECIYGRCEGGNVVHEEVPHLHKDGTCFIDGGCYEPNEFRNAVSANDPCSRCKPGTSQSQWTAGEPFDTAYRCVAHHDSSPYTNVNWAFHSESTRSDSGDAHFDLNRYSTNHLCVKQRNESTGPNNETTSMDDPRYWQKIPAGLTAQPTWPNDFAEMSHKISDPNVYFNAKETRDWLFNNYRVRYLGQMNNRPDEAYGGEPFYFGRLPTQLYLKPGETEWLAFYYNDRERENRDRIGVLAQFDPSNLDVEVKTHFVCAYDGGGGRPRIDGFTYCGAEGPDAERFGRDPGSRASANDMGVKCGESYNSHLSLTRRNDGVGGIRTRYSSCVGDTAVPENKLPWSWRRLSGDVGTQDGFGPNIAGWWGGAQAGIYVEGHIDCGAPPGQKTYSNGSPIDRSGWVFIRVKRKNTPGKNLDTKCTPITIRATWFSHELPGYTHKCW